MVEHRDGKRRKTSPDSNWAGYRWLILVAVGTFSGVLAWKTLTTDFTALAENFSFSELLSLLLAFFAISVSIAFYFKAMETSNTFYDNTYRFTNDVSEVLGRIESGFSERLRHLDEGYSKLGDKFDKIPFSTYEAQEELNREKEGIARKEEERDQLIRDLLEKAQLKEGESAEYLERLKSQEKELAEAQHQLSVLSGRLHKAEGQREPNFSGEQRRVHGRVEEFMSSDVVRKLGPLFIQVADTQDVLSAFDDLREDLPNLFIRELTALGYADEEGRLSELGVRRLRELADNESR